MAAMNALFLSSVFEGSPNVLIEAQALGVPVVTMPAGGAVETVDDGRSGWVAGSGTAREAAERLIALVEHPELCRRAGAHAAEFVRSRFALERMVEETAAVYGGLRPRALGTVRGDTE